MEVIVLPGPGEVGEMAARRVAAVLGPRRPGVLGVATGSSPLAAYRALAAMRRDGEIDFSQTVGFALDEYVGIAVNHPQSYHQVIRREVVEPLGMDPELVHVPDGQSDDLDAACRQYEEQIAAAGGIDLQILGIGADGHIGFNEPTSSLSSRTRLKTLTERTRQDNARFFADVSEVPRHCLTQGLGTILDARNVVLVAHGRAKAAAVAAAIEGPLSSTCPASVLQLHGSATVVVDEEAASALRLTDYYREVWAGKPAWQRW